MLLQPPIPLLVIIKKINGHLLIHIIHLLTSFHSSCQYLSIRRQMFQGYLGVRTQESIIAFKASTNCSRSWPEDESVGLHFLCERICDKPQ